MTELLLVHFVILTIQIVVLFYYLWRSTSSLSRRRAIGNWLFGIGVVEVAFFLSVVFLNSQLRSRWHSLTIGDVLTYAMVAIGFVTLVVGAIQATYCPRPITKKGPIEVSSSG